MTEAANSAVAIRALRKSFGATLAVDDVSFTIEQGTAHALLGENGAGKSTIVKLLSGLIEPDHGTISLFDDEVRLRSPRVAHRRGVQTVGSEMTLTPDLTVLDNMLLPYGPQGWSGMIGRGRRRTRGSRAFRQSRSRHRAVGAKSANRSGDSAKDRDRARVFRRPRLLLLRRADFDARRPRRRLARGGSSRISNNRASPILSSRIACARCGRFAIT
jgi:ribose transport system ATP-binding protein